MPEVTLDGVNVHYLDEGEADTAVVLLHAFPLRAAMWSPQVDALAPTSRVVAPDLLGFGATDAPDDPLAYSVGGWADQVARLLDHLGLTQIVLVGLSMGGYAALAFARRHRSRLAGLVLADTRPGADTPQTAQRRRDQIDQIRRGDLAGVVETQLGGLLGRHTHEHRPEVVATTRSLMDSAPAGFIGALDAMIRRPDATVELASIAVPTLVVVGEEDTLSPVEVARGMQTAIPDARLAVIPEAGHLTNLEAPDHFNQAVASLVERCQRDPGGR